MTSSADAERSALSDLLEEVGPDAPTLCTEWSTRELAAHLVLRDRAPKAWAGMVVPRLSGIADRALAEISRQPYGDLVAQVRGGAPLWSPMGLPVLKDATNLLEYLIHHEDVRRARPGWVPRAIPSPLADSVWTAVRLVARPAFRRAGAGVVLRRAGTDSAVTARRGRPAVTVVGDPVELALFMAGRKAVARVELHGDPDAVARLEAAPLSF